MSAEQGLGIEVEQLGQVALFGLLLIPGAIWIARSKSGTSMAVRAVFVGAVLAGAAVLEGRLDRAANAITGES